MKIIKEIRMTTLWGPIFSNLFIDAYMKISRPSYLDGNDQQIF